MNPPPDHLAATVELPVNRSRAATTLSPAAPGLPSVADHEIVVWVTSSAVHEPVIVQIGRGLRTSVMSARTVAGEPCMTSKASWVAGAAVDDAGKEGLAGPAPPAC